MGPGGVELSLGFNDSGGERMTALARGAAVFKTLNQPPTGTLLWAAQTKCGFGVEEEDMAAAGMS